VVAATGRLTIGSLVDGSCPALGEFDELTTFSQELNESSLGCYYFFMHSLVDLGPITSDEEASQKAATIKSRYRERLLLGTLPAWLGAKAMGEYDGLYLLTPNIQGTNIHLTIYGGATNQSYDILYSSSLFDQMTSSDWSVSALGVYGQTNFTIPMQGNAGFYRVQIVNGIQIWQLADPSNTNSGFLTITIDNPSNGSTVH
jgi:hypothetical protein